ncbi:RhuM family protein [uncultured Methanobrevibacter sp.]|uniref:RhuM family protein n=1 Tax=uncultured Methanobrevibacter sp. TaxID=253161 RepID=UPI0026137E22|nr:RhuM family protein [uncultured Methanobrevibacter sp.]
MWYNLDAIISIGYRINSKEVINFCKCFREILKQYVRKGFFIKKELFKSDYNKFDEETKKFLV